MRTYPPGVIPSIHACMQEHDLKVSQLDKLLDTIEKARELVISRRAEHASLANAYRNVLSPLRNFPAELLEQIFLLCVRSVNDTLSPDNPPWVFGKVCRRWRSVALSSSRLWNVIPALSSRTRFYTPSRRNTMGTKSEIELLSTSLRLSCTLPLSIDFSIDLCDVNGRPMLNVISSHLYRCHSLAVATDPICLPLLNQTFRDKCPSLHCLSISVVGSATELVRCESLTSFQHLSSIRVLHIGVHPNKIGITVIRAANTGPSISSWLKIAWKNLTTFSGHGLQAQYLTDLLQNAPSLIKCTFADLIPRDHTNRFTVVKHTSLRSFDFSIWQGFEFPTGLLDFIMLPFLVELSIPLDNDQVTVKSLVSFFLRSSSSLSTLTLKGKNFEPDNMGTILTSLKSSPLTTLNLNFKTGIELDLVHLELLIKQPSDGMLPILPHLQHITAELKETSYSDISYGLDSFKELSKKINQLIESRLYMSNILGTKALETVTLTCSGGLSTMLLKELEGWSESPPQQSQVTYTTFKHWYSVFEKMHLKLCNPSIQVNKEVNHPLI